MSKQSEAKEKQNYGAPHQCGSCKHFSADMVFPAWIEARNKLQGVRIYGEEYKRERNLKCIIGGFSVKKTYVCDLWEKK